MSLPLPAVTEDNIRWFPFVWSRPACEGQDSFCDTLEPAAFANVKF